MLHAACPFDEEEGQGNPCTCKLVVWYPLQCQNEDVQWTEEFIRDYLSLAEYVH